jgi:hypothetical protein
MLPDYGAYVEDIPKAKAAALKVIELDLRERPANLKELARGFESWKFSSWCFVNWLVREKRKNGSGPLICGKSRNYAQCGL